MKRSTTALFALTALTLGAGLAAGAAARVGAFQDVPPGVRVGGRLIPVTPSLATWLDQRKTDIGSREVIVATGTDALPTPLADLGVELDVAATAARVEASVSGSLRNRADVLMKARAGEIDVPVVFRLDRAKAHMVLDKLAPALRREPVSARLDLMAHMCIEDVPGQELDVEATINALAALPHEPGDVLPMVLKAVRAPVTSADIASVDVSKVLASNETTFVLWGTGAGRAVNIQTAARKLDGLILGVGETFSFNDVVGPRTIEAGFAQAPEIVGDELEMGIGGGTCQVASTLHAAAIFGALEIVDRQSHGRPSAYTKMGLDATVAYGKVDLKIKNPFEFPIILHAYLPKPTALRVEVLGADPVAKVEYRYGVNRSDDYFRRITLKPYLPAGKVVKHQKGIRGFAVGSIVTTTYHDGRTVERSYFSEYRPVPEVFWVGPGFEEGALPELPEGVQRVERRGLPKPPAEATAGAG